MPATEAGHRGGRAGPSGTACSLAALRAGVSRRDPPPPWPSSVFLAHRPLLGRLSELCPSLTRLLGPAG